jgi:competence protein ComEA
VISLLSVPGSAPAAGPLEIESKIDPNTANWAELASLPGIGEVLAKRIVEYRQAQPGKASKAVFRRPEDLEAVRGIGPKTVAKLAKHLKFPETATAPGP